MAEGHPGESAEPSGAAAATPAPALLGDRPRVTAICATLAVVACYVLLVNPYWQYMQDSATYVGLSRNIGAGHGFVLNGLPHRAQPPGMPVLLCVLAAVSDSFLWINAAVCVLALAGLCLYCRAFAAEWGGAAAAILVASSSCMFWMYAFATTPMSEGPFLFLSGLLLVLLSRILRCRQFPARLGLFAALCVTWCLAFCFRGVAAFWLGPFAVVLALERRSGCRLGERAIRTLVFAALVLTGILVYAAWSGGGGEAHEAKSYLDGVRIDDLLGRLATFPRWVPLLLVPPWDVAGRVYLPPGVFTAANLLCLGLVVAGAWRAWRAGRELSAASVLYLLPFLVWRTGLETTWGRLGAAVVPFIFLLFLLGLQSSGQWARRHLHAGIRPGWFVAAGAAAVLLPNVVLLAGDIWVRRQPDFLAQYRGGAYADLLGIARHLQDLGRGTGVGVDDDAAERVLPALTWRRAVRIREAASDDVAGMARDSAAAGLRLFVTRNTKRPWPVWHLRRRPGPLGEPPEPYWQLWECMPPGGARMVPTEPQYAWPRRVPHGSAEDPDREP